MEKVSLKSLDMRGKTITTHILFHTAQAIKGLGENDVQEIVTVDDPAIISAMRLVWERMKIVIEPSAAVPLAALLAGKLNIRGMRVGIIVSGGNVDLEKLPWLP